MARLRQSWRKAHPLDAPSELLDLIYEAALLPEAWPKALDAVAKVAQASGGILFATSGRFAGWRSSATVQEAGQKFIEEGWIQRSRRTPLIMAWNQPGFLRDSDVWNDAELAADPLQTELLLPAGLGRDMATLIATPSGEKIVLSVLRPLSAGPYDDATLERVDRLRPHLARAAVLSARLGMDRMRAAVKLLDVVGLAAAIVGPGRTVLASNALFDAVPQVVPLAFSRLGLRSPSAHRRLEEALVRIEAGRPGRLLSLLLAADEAAPDSVLHVVPLRRDARDLMAGAVAVVVVTPGRSSAAPSIDLLNSLFDLTVGEARVARGLMNGSIQDFAAASSVSVETVRTQLKAVLRKTGTGRQSGLVALLTRLSLVDANRAPVPE